MLKVQGLNHLARQRQLDFSATEALKFVCNKEKKLLVDMK